MLVNALTMELNTNDSDVMELDVSESDMMDLGIEEINTMDLDIESDVTSELMDFNEQEEITKKFVFVDIQGFKSYRDRFICKEICLVSDEDFYHAIIKSTIPFEKLSSSHKRQANWLTKHFHGLTYDCGNVHMIQAIQDVYPMLMKKTVVVKGTEKIKWMKHIFRNCGEIECLNFEDLDLDLSLDDTSKNICPFMCDYHLEKTFANMHICRTREEKPPRSKYHCAKAHAFEIEYAVKKSNYTYIL